jgi:hypothetical protein
MHHFNVGGLEGVRVGELKMRVISTEVERSLFSSTVFSSEVQMFPCLAPEYTEDTEKKGHFDRNAVEWRNLCLVQMFSAQGFN